ncbi:hypothetical protein BKK79_01085 [Cupriavidus sp. USMAA2-4]|nr:hypothetical protein BKK79_01085 [Cupriavidus sp. USMAA2-4]
MDLRTPLTRQQYLDELNARLRECPDLASVVVFAFDPPGAGAATATGVRADGAVDEDLLCVMTGIVETAADAYHVVTDPPAAATED